MAISNWKFLRGSSFFFCNCSGNDFIAIFDLFGTKLQTKKPCAKRKKKKQKKLVK